MNELVMKLKKNFLDGPVVTPGNYWIPFKVESGVTDFSHEDYTSLTFSENPGKYRVERAFRRIFFYSDHRYKLLHHLTLGLDYHKKLLLLDKIKTEVNEKILDLSRFKLSNIFIHRDTVIAKNKSILDHINSRINELGPIVSQQKYQFKPEKPDAKKGALTEFIEWAINPIINKNVEVENVEEFVRDLGNYFGIDIGDSYKTTKSRIEKKKIEEFKSYQFCIKLKELAKDREN